MRQWSLRHAPSFTLVSALALCVACGSQEPDVAPRASLGVKPSQATAEAGSPIEFEYHLTMMPGTALLPGTHWVFVHMLDESGALLWTDDHAPPSSWATAPATYRRTMFVPRIPYAGRVRVEAGLFSRDDGTRVALAGTDRGNHAYEVASFEVTPASNAVFVSFGDGWHGAERDAGEAGREWRWSTRATHLSFRRPQRDAVLWIEWDQPVDAVGLQTVEVRAGSELMASLPVTPGSRRVERVPLASSRLGTAPTVDLELLVQPTFVPATTAPLNSQDTRELGVRVFNVHVSVP